MSGLMSRSAIVAGFAALVSTSVFPVEARAEEDAREHYYMFMKERMPMALDTTRLAVFRDSAAAEDARAGDAPAQLSRLLDTTALKGAALTAHALKGWAYATVPAEAARAGDAGITDLVAQVADSGVVDFVSPVFIDEYGPRLVTRDIFVGFGPEILPEQADELIAQLDLGRVIDREFAGMRGVYRVRSDSRNGFVVLEKANEAALRPEVNFAEPDMVFTARADLIPNDPQFNQLWGIHQASNFDMDGPEAWDITIGHSSVITIIMDDGIELTHPDLASNIAFAMDFTGNGTGGNHIASNPCEGHGTNVAGCVAAIINNSLGVVGIAPGTRLAAAKFAVLNVPCDGTASTSSSIIASAINWSLTIGARVTNTSYSLGQSGTVETAFQNTRNQGVVHFAATGNSGGGTIAYPASSAFVNGIGAIQQNGTRASFSQFGTGIAFMAPGQSIRTTSRFNGYSTVSGTSFSSPYAAGNAALVVTRNNLLTAAEIESILFGSCVDMGTPGYDTTHGWGLVKARAAIDATPSPSPPGPFNLVSPSNGQTQVVRTPTLTWSASQFASNYEVMVDDAPDFTTPILVVNTTLTSHSLAGTPLDPATTYYWKVHATNPLGARDSTPFSASFTTYTIPPGDFNLTSPADGAMNISVKPTLQWTAANLAETYNVQIDNDPDFSSPVVNANTTLTIYSVFSSLAPDTVYHWRVTANNLIGSTPSTPASRSFRTVATPPQNFNLQSPADGAFINTFTPTLNWSDSVGAESYRLQVDDQLNFSSPEINLTGLEESQYTIPEGILQNETRYYWRVYAVNVIGEVASTPSVYNFAVVVETCCPGNADKIRPGSVTFGDITAVLVNFGTFVPGGEGVGDADCNGTVNFTDVTTVLVNFGNFCP